MKVRYSLHVYYPTQVWTPCLTVDTPKPMKIDPRSIVTSAECELVPVSKWRQVLVCDWNGVTSSPFNVWLWKSDTRVTSIQPSLDSLCNIKHPKIHENWSSIVTSAECEFVPLSKWRQVLVCGWNGLTSSPFNVCLWRFDTHFTSIQPSLDSTPDTWHFKIHENWSSILIRIYPAE